MRDVVGRLRRGKVVERQRDRARRFGLVCGTLTDTRWGRGEDEVDRNDCNDRFEEYHSCSLHYWLRWGPTPSACHASLASLARGADSNA